LWPPNHKEVEIATLWAHDGITLDITDIRYIYQDEPLNTYGDGNTEPDGRAEVDADYGPDGWWLRAERVGTKKVPGDGRVYYIGLNASAEVEGKTCVYDIDVKVGVPHDKKDDFVNGRLKPSCLSATDNKPAVLYDSTDIDGCMALDCSGAASCEECIVMDQWINLCQ
jgi:hypothetical protein